MTSVSNVSLGWTIAVGQPDVAFNMLIIQLQRKGRLLQNSKRPVATAAAATCCYWRNNTISDKVATCADSVTAVIRTK